MLSPRDLSLVVRTIIIMYNQVNDSGVIRVKALSKDWEFESSSDGALEEGYKRNLNNTLLTAQLFRNLKLLLNCAIN